MDAIFSLKSALANANAAALARTPFAVDLQSTIRYLKAKVNSSSGSTESRDRVSEAVKAFFIDTKVDSLQAARYISFGLATKPDKSIPMLLDDLNKFNYFLNEENGIGQWISKPAWFRRILQGLVVSYFAFDPDSPLSTNTQKQNWIALRNYIGNNLSRAKTVTNPDWLNCCLDHPSLFTESPGDDFIELVLNGDTDQLELNLDLLRAKESWLPRELIISQVKRICGFEDSKFTSHVSSILSAVMPHRTIQDSSMALLVNRYSENKNSSIHQELKEATVARWDNPWLSGSNKKWPTEVTENGKALIADWLKSEFIEAFFTKMAEDGATDRRRLNFWMRYKKQMNHVHFALGTEIIDSTDPDLIFLRNKMKGLVSTIRSRRVNAFVMYLGEVIAVEFSQMGNALYFYDTSSSAPFDLNEPLDLAKDGENSLKNTSGISFRHQDGTKGFDLWETSCESFMSKSLGIQPDTSNENYLTSKGTKRSPSSKPIEFLKSQQKTPGNITIAKNPDILESLKASDSSHREFEVVSGKTSWSELFNQPYSDKLLAATCYAFGFDIQDNRSHGGALWVNIGDSVSGRNRVFIKWGFRYKAPKGWWKNS